MKKSEVRKLVVKEAERYLATIFSKLMFFVVLVVVLGLSVIGFISLFSPEVEYSIKVLSLIAGFLIAIVVFGKIDGG